MLHESSSAGALICEDSSILQNAGSGGAFSLMAKHILDKGGVVIGAAWSADWQVEHIASYNWQHARTSQEELFRIDCRQHRLLWCAISRCMGTLSVRITNCPKIRRNQRSFFSEKKLTTTL